jgi:chemotaxis protein CheX
MQQTQRDARTLQLPEILDISRAGPLAESFRASRGAQLAVDAARVRCVGAQCAQVIMSAVATWEADDVALCLTDPSPEFRETFSLLGLGLAEISTEETAQ